MLDAFNAEVQPLGCAALVEASHLGDDVGPSKLTFSSLGCFYANPKVYLQVLPLIILASIVQIVCMIYNARTGKHDHIVLLLLLICKQDAAHMWCLALAFNQVMICVHAK